MAILTPNEVPPKIIRELDPPVEDEINNHLVKGIWEWSVDKDFLLDKDLIKETMIYAGWNCKFETRGTVDPEVRQDWIVLSKRTGSQS